VREGHLFSLVAASRAEEVEEDDGEGVVESRLA
jgi:hypothetical protein